MWVHKNYWRLQWKTAMPVVTIRNKRHYIYKVNLELCSTHTDGEASALSVLRCTRMRFLPQLHFFEYIHCPINRRFFSTLCEEHWVDFDARAVPQPLGQLGKVEALQAEADFQMLSASFHLVRNGHVCERERGFVQKPFKQDSKGLARVSINLLATSGSPSNCRK